MMKRSLLILVAMVCVVAMSLPAKAQDMGSPDSLYFLTPTVELINCSREVRVILPLYLWSDRSAFFFGGGIFWAGVRANDTATVQSLTTCNACLADFGSDFVAKECHASLACSCGITPGSGIIAEFVFRAQLGDTLRVTQSDRLFQLVELASSWYPIYQAVDTFFVLPDTLAAETGDADCSGSIDISDAVFLISYIFSGGIRPYDRNAADENADCEVDISDAVYLIAYIFAGGPAPQQAGCVVP
jgi:hypothetical protein